MTDTLSLCGREEAIIRMNRFGSEGRPFFFLIDYTAEKCLVEEPHRLPSSELLFAFPGATNVPQGMSATPRPVSFQGPIGSPVTICTNESPYASIFGQ